MSHNHYPDFCFVKECPAMQFYRISRRTQSIWCVKFEIEMCYFWDSSQNFIVGIILNNEMALALIYEQDCCCLAWP